MVLETKLRNNDAAYYKSVGDGIAKIKIDSRMSPLEQTKAGFHEYGHFWFDVFRFNRKGKRVSEKEEDEICYEIGDAVEKIYMKYFGDKK